MVQMCFKFCNAALTQLIGYDISKTDFGSRSILKNQGSNLFFAPIFRQAGQFDDDTKMTLGSSIATVSSINSGCSPRRVHFESADPEQDDKLNISSESVSKMAKHILPGDYQGVGKLSVPSIPQFEMLRIP